MLLKLRLVVKMTLTALTTLMAPKIPSLRRINGTELSQQVFIERMKRLAAVVESVTNFSAIIFNIVMLVCPLCSYLQSGMLTWRPKHVESLGAYSFQSRTRFPGVCSTSKMYAFLSPLLVLHVLLNIIDFIFFQVVCDRVSKTAAYKSALKDSNVVAVFCSVSVV
jgi:hypothetical protein